MQLEPLKCSGWCRTASVDVSSYLPGGKVSFHTRARKETKSWELKSFANSQKPQLLEQNVMLFFSHITKEEMKREQRCHLGRMLALRHRDQWKRLNIPTQGSQEGWEASVSLKCFSRQRLLSGVLQGLQCCNIGVKIKTQRDPSSLLLFAPLCVFQASLLILF